MPDIIQSRRKYNDLIEELTIDTAICVRNIHTFKQTERNASVLTLFEGFYANFDLLYILTGHMQLMKDNPIVKKAETWLKANRKLQSKQEQEILTIANSGSDIFMEYHALMHTNAIIALPSTR